MYKNLHIHFIGIGGIGMAGIAEVLLNLGYPVTGSDKKLSLVTEDLAKKGAVIYNDHKAEHVHKADVVVYSSAVAKDNIERVEATRLKIPVIKRAEMLSELMRLKKYGIAIAGTHGKTTTTSLLASVLETSGLDPTLVIGGKLNPLGSGAKLGKGDFMVVEADESDSSFLHLSPTLAVVTNIDADHLENFKDEAHYTQAFVEFVQKIPFYGLCVVCAEDAKAKAMISKIDRRVQTYGFDLAYDYAAQNLKASTSKTEFDLYKNQTFLGKITLALMGEHNVLNALAVVAIAFELGLDFQTIHQGLKEFSGVGRRLECLYEDEACLLFDDYGHHPTEISATLKALKEAYPHHYLKIIFQPHRFSRLKFFFEEFTHCFKNADAVYLMPVYAAGENPIRGVTSDTLKSAIKAVHPAVYTFDETVPHRIFEPFKNEMNEIVLTMGAGDITQWAKHLKEFLSKKL